MQGRAAVVQPRLSRTEFDRDEETRAAVAERAKRLVAEHIHHTEREDRTGDVRLEPLRRGRFALRTDCAVELVERAVG